MPRKRMIDPGIWRSEQVNNLSREARLLFIGIFSNADDDGRLHGSARFLKANIFPYDDDAPATTVEAWRNEIINAGLCVLYRNDGREYLHLPTWRRHQKIDRPSASILPSPEDSTSEQSTGDDDSTRIRRTLVECSSLIEKNRSKENTREEEGGMGGTAPGGATSADDPGDGDDLPEMTPLEDELRQLKSWGRFTMDDRAWLEELLRDYQQVLPRDVRDCRDHWMSKAKKHSRYEWKRRFRTWVRRKGEFHGGNGNDRHRGLPGNQYGGAFSDITP